MRRLALAAILLFTFGMVHAQTLVYGASSSPTTLDSADAQDGNSLVVSGQITERLVDFVPGGTDLMPGLATSWTSNDDATVWTFNLREGVKFHDGTPFNADAVKFNIDRWNEAGNPYGSRDQGKTFVPFNWVFGGPIGEGNLIESVTAVSEYVVEVATTEPAPFLPAMFAAIYFQLGSPTAIKAAGVTYGTPNAGAVGTGPFKFVEWIEGERVVVERNDDYWNGPAGVKTVVFRWNSEPTARLAELQAGSIDIAVALSSDALPIVKADANLVPQSAAGELNVGYIAFSQTTPEMSNVLVRRAIAHAIDRQAIVDAFYEGLGVVAQDHLPPTMFGHGEPWPYEYNPEKAKELLAEAGYPNGFTTEFWYMPVSRSYYPAPQPIAETVASYLADVGINVQLKTEDWSTYLADYPSGKFPMYMLGWNADYADPDNFLRTFFGPEHSAAQGWDNPEVLAALSRAQQTGDHDLRAALYASVVDAVAEAAASIPMAHNVSLNATRKSVSGWVPSPLGYSSVSLHPVTKTE